MKCTVGRWHPGTAREKDPRLPSGPQSPPSTFFRRPRRISARPIRCRNKPREADSSRPALSKCCPDTWECRGALESLPFSTRRLFDRRTSKFFSRHRNMTTADRPRDREPYSSPILPRRPLRSWNPPPRTARRCRPRWHIASGPIARKRCAPRPRNRSPGN